MPCPRPDCPARPAPGRAIAAASALAALLALAQPAAATEPKAQTWSVHAFGVKVGEFFLQAEENDAGYAARSAFRSTGLAGLLKNVRFSVSAAGKISGGTYSPSFYEGLIDTGRRVSENRLDFVGGVPKLTKGQKAKPHRRISQADRRGAHDPMTLVWRVLRDQTDDTLCTLDQTQYDGTRLTRVTLTTRKQAGDVVTCSGQYERIGGYRPKELEELRVSPVAVTYVRVGEAWRAVELTADTRHGMATMKRRQ